MFNKKKLIVVILFGLFLFLVFLKGLNNPANYSPKNISIKIDTKLTGKMLYQNKEVSLGELMDKNNFSLIKFDLKLRYFFIITKNIHNAPFLPPPSDTMPDL